MATITAVRTTTMASILISRPIVATSASVRGSATACHRLESGLDTAHAAALPGHRYDHCGDVDRVGLVTAPATLAPFARIHGAGQDPRPIRGFEHPVTSMLQHLRFGIDLRFCRQNVSPPMLLAPRVRLPPEALMMWCPPIHRPVPPPEVLELGVTRGAARATFGVVKATDADPADDGVTRGAAR